MFVLLLFVNVSFNNAKKIRTVDFYIVPLGELLFCFALVLVLVLVVFIR
jgi:hypothetical protein